MKTGRERKNAAIVVMRWSARVLGLIMAGFLLLMFIGQSLESYPPSEPIAPIAASNRVCPDGNLCSGYVPGTQMGAAGLVSWGGSPRRLLCHTLPGTASRKRFRRLQFQRRPESVISSLLATDPVVLAVLGARKAGAGTNEGGSLNRMSI